MKLNTLKKSFIIREGEKVTFLKYVNDVRERMDKEYQEKTLHRFMIVNQDKLKKEWFGAGLIQID